MSGRLQYSSFITSDAFKANFNPTCSIIDPGNFFQDATPADTVATGDEIDVMARPGQQQEEEDAQQDLGITFNAPTKVVHQFVVDSSKTVSFFNGSPNNYSVNISPTMTNVLQIKLVHASVPNPLSQRYCVIKIDGLSRIQLSGNSIDLQEAFHVLPVSIDPADNYFFNIPVYMPVVMDTNSTFDRLDISIYDSDGNLYDFDDPDNPGTNMHHLLIFEFETRA